MTEQDNYQYKVCWARIWELNGLEQGIEQTNPFKPFSKTFSMCKIRVQSLKANVAIGSKNIAYGFKNCMFSHFLNMYYSIKIEPNQDR